MTRAQEMPPSCRFGKPQSLVLNLALDSRRGAGAPLAAGEAAAQAVWHAVQAPYVALVRGAARAADVVPAAHA